jgi:NAD(P)H dehydrogenase (quinone)
MNEHRSHAIRRRLLGVALCATLLGGTLPAFAASAPKGARVNDKFIISGASGQLGEDAIKELLARGVPAKNLILVSRSPEKLAEYKKLGADTRFGDVDKPESLAAAYKGGTRMLMISLGVSPGNPPRAPRHKLAFDAAAKAGVKQIAYTSFMGAGDPNPTMLAADHAQSEAFLRASGAAWTALRNGIYMDSQLDAAVRMAETGKAYARPNETKSAPVTREDCAIAAVAALLYPGHENKAYDITGPELIDTSDVARIVATMVGKPVSVETGFAPGGPGGPRGPGGPGGPGPGGPGGPGAPGGPGGAGAPPAGMAMPGPAEPGTVSNAFTELTGRPATSVKALLEANKAQLLAAAAKR